jgi:Ca-activated chloride channel family protein
MPRLPIEKDPGSPLRAARARSSMPMICDLPRCGLRLLLASVALLLAAAGLPAQQQKQQQQQQQQPPPTFRTGTRTVPVFVTVLDADGRLVPDLGRGDFTILDNGKPQEITVFANEVQPITVVLLLDRSVSMALNFRLEREAAEQFVVELMPSDRAKIGSFSNRIQIDPPDFTNDHNALIEVLNMELQNAGGTPLWSAVDAGMTALLRQEGRRVVLVFTDGGDYPGSDFDGPYRSLRDVMKRALVEDVMVYAVGLAGYLPGTRVSSMGPLGRGGAGGWSGGSGGGTGMEMRPDKGLATIAAESGGGYFELKSANNLAATFARVAEELHHQYALGFVPEVLDGKTHKLEVRMARSGMTARSRQSYLASPEARTRKGSIPSP